MNSVKNAIVTMTLLAVGYGAYVVLNNPVPDDLADLSGEDAWVPPAVVTPGENELAATDSPSVSLPESSDAATSLPVEMPSEFTSPAAAQGMRAGGDQLAATTLTESPGYNDLGGSQAPVDTWSDPANPDGQSFAPPASAEDAYRDHQVSQVSAASTDPGYGQAPSPASASPAANPGSSTSLATVDPAATSDMADPNRWDPGATQDYPSTAAPDLPLGAPVSRYSEATSGDPARERMPVEASGFEASWQSAAADLDNGQYANALVTLSAWYDHPALNEEQQSRCLQMLDQLAGAVIYSRDSHLEPAHVVADGETLDDLARQYAVTPAFLARLNGIEAPYQLYPGESLKVVQGPFRAVIRRNSRELTLFLGQHYAGRFAVRLGQDVPAGDRVFEVASVERGREYFDSRSGYRVGPEHPENPYGSHWIGLRGDKITAAHNVGIHIDNGESQRCCIGVSPEDAADLSIILTVGAELTIVE